MSTSKRIETFVVRLNTNSQIHFYDLLSHQSIRDKEILIRHKEISFKILDENDEVIVGLIETQRKNNVPAKKNSKSKTITSLGLKDEEGLVYANAFLFEKKRNIMMYEVNKNGSPVDHFCDFIYTHYRHHSDFGPFDIKLLPVLNADEYQRMIHMRSHKSIHVQVAHPNQIIQDYTHKKDAIYSACKFAAEAGSEVMDIKYHTDARNKTSKLKSGKIKQMVDRVLEIGQGLMGANVKKIIVTGYDTDSEKVQSIDLIADRFIRHIELSEPRQNSDLLENQRKKKLKNLYITCLPEFTSIFGDE